MAKTTEEVEIKVSAETSQALEAWREIADGPLALQNALDRISQLEGQRSRGLARELENVVGKWTSIGFAIGKAQEFLRAYLDTAAELRQESVDATRDIDTASRQYFMSSGIRPGTSEANQAMQRITGAAQTGGETMQSAFGAARLLAEFGATRDQQQGAALSAMLDLQDVTNLGGGDAQGTSRAVLEILRRNGRPITGESINQLGGTATQLMAAGSGFNVGQLEEYSNVASAASQYGLSFSEGLSMWAAMREQEGTRRARSQFMALVDQTDRPGEAGRRAALRERGAELLGAGGLSYEERVGIASGSMVEGEEAARAGYAASGYRAGAVDIQTVRERFLTLRRQQTGSAGGLGEQLEMTAFDWTAYWNANDPEATARQMGGGRFVGPNAGQRNQQFVNQLLGREPMPAFNIRLTGPDGRDVPHEIEALGIQGR